MGLEIEEQLPQEEKTYTKKSSRCSLFLLFLSFASLSILLSSGGKKLKFHPPRFMTATQAAKQLLEVEASKKLVAYGPETVAVALARVGAEDQAVVVATLGEFARAGEAEEEAARSEAEEASETGELLPGVASAAATAAADALLKRPLGGPLHSLVIAGDIHSVEAELLDTFR